jgi:uncharacterized protein YndB with AHSA1/START domain
MPSLMIEQDVLIEAPTEVVWRVITEPSQMSQWFADKVDLVIEPGAHGYLGFGDQGGPVVVETVDPPARFSFRWNYPSGEEPVVGNSILVEFTLTPEGDERTRLRVNESGHELRRRVLDLLVSNGAVSASWLAGRVPFSRQAVAKHLVVLERAGLISGRKQGKEVLYQVQAERLDQATRAMTELAAQWDRRLATIKRLAETAHAENKTEEPS